MSGSQLPSSFNPGSLYIARLYQARSPHAGLIIPTGASSGRLFHIRIDRTTSPVWKFQSRNQKIEGDMFFSTLLKIRDVSDGEVTEQLENAAASVPAPPNDEFGECLPLHEMGVVNLTDAGGLGKEFQDFAAGNTAFATRRRFSNVKAAKSCS
ncbi:hypothetical protein K439DRAFT_1647659 [Ramaria rubella]|nr:hypothetical protein K439DRAFT_1647659 [Ramaria rubella]